MPATFPVPFLRFAALALVATACATVPSTRLESSAGLRSAYAPNLLTASDMSSVQVNTAYDAVQRLKPNFLVSRGASFDRRTVYLNGARLLGGVENLRAIEASSVRDIVFLSAIEATARFGTGNGAGALLVTTWAGSSTR